MTRRYKKSYSRRSSKRFHVTFDNTATVGLSEADKIRAAIQRDETFIETYPNYPTLCAEAQARIVANRVKLARVLDEDKTLISQPWTSIIPSNGELSKRSYKGRDVPGCFCPRDGLPLIVNEKEYKTVEAGAPYYERRLVCSGFFTTGCSYKEPWTEEILAILNQTIEVDVNF